MANEEKKDAKSVKEIKDSKASKTPKEAKDSKDSKDIKGTKEAKEAKDSKDIKGTKEAKEHKEVSKASRDANTSPTKSQSALKDSKLTESKSPLKSETKLVAKTGGASSLPKSSTPTTSVSSTSLHSKPQPKPTIDQYNALKKKLIQLILKKQEINAKLSKLEDQLYQKESNYFEESTVGNIVKGFENFSKASGGALLSSGGGGGGGGKGGSGSGGGGGGAGGGAGGGGYKRRIIYTDDDHIFSLSSTNFVKNMVKKHGQNFKESTPTTNGGSGANSSIASGNTSKQEDFDDYEDSVDPITAHGVGPKLMLSLSGSGSGNGSGKGNGNGNSSSGGGGGGNGGGGSSREKSESASSTPSRKRKARNLDD